MKWVIAAIVVATLFAPEAVALVARADATVVDSNVTVPLTRGRGSATFHLALRENLVSLPAIDWTSAAGPEGATIPRNDIRVEFPPLQQSAAARTFPVTVFIDTKAPLEPTATYTGKVLVFTTERQDVTFTATVAATATFEIDPRTINTSFGAFDDASRLIRVRNTSKVALDGVTISSLGFSRADGKTVALEEEDAVLPKRNNVVRVKFPYPHRAGTYTGALDVTGATGEQRNMAVTFTVRGPYGRWGVPLVLLLLTVTLGWVGSEALERRWSERRIEQLELERVFSGSAAQLRKTLTVLQTWAGGGAALPNTQASFAVHLAAVEESLEMISTLTADAARSRAAAAQNASASARTLSSVLGSMSPDGGLAAIVDAIPTDDANYRQRLLEAISGTTVDRGADAGRAGARRTAADITAQLRRVKFMRGAILLAVALLVAYQTFYEAERDFGTATDYINVFLWSLGMTQAGTQIITRVRSLRAT